MSTPMLVLLSSLYLVAFGVVHSVLSMERVKVWARRVMGRGYAFYRLLYTVIALAGILGFVALFTPYDWLLYRIRMPWLPLFLGIEIACVVLVIWCLFVAFDGLEFIGVRQLRALRGTRPPETDIPLKTDGPFGWCRHPVYFGTIVYCVASPYMTVVLMVFTVWTIVYAFVGSIPEERRLLAHYGEAYAAYQARTKRIIPFVW